MQSSSLTTHIFKDCETFFSEKVQSFHDQYVDTFLLIGMDLPSVPLDEIKMTKNPTFSQLFYSRIVGGILKTSPLISILNYSKEKKDSSFDIFYLDNNEDIDGFFLLQKVHNWKNSTLTCTQVWNMSEKNLFNINNFWFF